MNLEYIVIDGGSTDNSVDIIQKYASKISYWISEKDNGQSDALNKGLRRVSGDIVAWINSDDWYEQGIFHEIAKQSKVHPGAVWLGNCMRHYEGKDKTRLIRAVDPTFYSMLRYWRVNFCPPQPSIFFSSKCLKSVGLLDEGLNYAMDLDLWLRIAQNFKFYYFDKTLSHYLIHDESKSGSGSGFKKFRKEWKLVCFKYLKKASPLERLLFYSDYFYHLLFKPSRIRE
jgi:glycosyltransferase involved in cell wall biosynthesis